MQYRRHSGLSFTAALIHNPAEVVTGVKALPAFRPPRPPPGGGGGGVGLRESELTQWASEHLSGTVLKSLHELVVSEPMPVMEG